MSSFAVMAEVELLRQSTSQSGEGKTVQGLLTGVNNQGIKN